MKVKDFVMLECSGAMFDAIDASLPGCFAFPHLLISADKNVLAQQYGDYDVVHFEPKTKRTIKIYIKPSI